MSDPTQTEHLPPPVTLLPDDQALAEDIADALSIPFLDPLLH